MKTNKRNESEKVNPSDQSQDLYKIYIEKGIPKERILSLGYVGVADSALKDLSIEKRNAMFQLCMNLHVVLSEAMKSKEERNEKKMLGFLQMAINESDNFYAGKSEAFLVHNLDPND